MNHAADAATSLNPDPIKVGDVAGQPAQRRGLLQGSVRPVGVVEVFVLPQHGHKVALATILLWLALSMCASFALLRPAVLRDWRGLFCTDVFP